MYLYSLTIKMMSKLDSRCAHKSRCSRPPLLQLQDLKRARKKQNGRIQELCSQCFTISQVATTLNLLVHMTRNYRSYRNCLLCIVRLRQEFNVCVSLQKKRHCLRLSSFLIISFCLHALQLIVQSSI